ncbi:MAG: hypothetical protein ACI4NM_05625 [Bullifex sp.]
MRKILALMLVLLLFISCSAVKNFTGEKGEDHYSAVFSGERGMDEHSITLAEGDSLEVVAEIEKGKLSMTVKSPDGSELYSGNFSDVKRFRINTLHEGMHMIAISADGVTGKLEIRKIKGEQ